MKTYRYNGKCRSAAGGQLLSPGGVYELPEGDNQVRSFVAQGLLEPAAKPVTEDISEAVTVAESEETETNNKKIKKTKK